MKKFHVVAIALVAAFAFFALATTSAFAEELLWLVNGTAFSGTLEAETEGFLELIRLNSSGEEAGIILCEGIFDGTITNGAPGATDATTKVLTLGMVDVGEDGSSLTGTGISCEVTLKLGDTTYCKVGGAGSATVWPANLEWLTELELMGTEPNAEWLDKLFKDGTDVNTGLPGYEVECTILLGIKATDLCTGNTSALVLLTLETLPGTTAEGSHGEFDWAAPISSEEGFCTTACPNTTPCAGLRGLGVTWAIEGELNRLETDVSEV
jgi:hypothetical protein